MSEKKRIFNRGYPFVHAPTHPKASRSGWVPEHTLIAEKALGKPLPKDAEVHHVDGTRTNTDNTNLVICENHAYHVLLHQRQRAFDACGNANFRKCVHCKLYSDHKTMKNRGSAFAHRACYAQYVKEYLNRKTEERRKEKDGRQHRTESKPTD